MKVAGTGCLTTSARDLIIDTLLNQEDFNFKKFYVSDYSQTLAQLTTPSTFENFSEDKLISTLATAGALSFPGDVTPGTSTIIEAGSTILPLTIKLLANAIPFDIGIKTVFALAEDLRGAKIELTNSGEAATFSVGETITQGTSTAVITYIEDEFLYVNEIKDSSVDGTYTDFTAGAVTGSSGGSSDIISSATNDVVIYSGCVSYDEILTFIVDTPANFTVGNYIVNDASVPARASIFSVHPSGTIRVNRINTENFNKGDLLDDVGSSTTAPYASLDGTILSNPETDTTNSTVQTFTYNADGAVSIFKINLRFSSGFPTNLNFLNTAVQEIEDHESVADAHDGRLLLKKVNGVVLQSEICDYDEDFVFGSTSLNDEGTVAHDKRFGFDKSKGTFISGDFSDSSADEVNRGDNCIISGDNNSCIGESGFISGKNNYIFEENSLSLGYNNKNSSSNSINSGSYNSIGGKQNIVAGESNIIGNPYRSCTINNTIITIAGDDYTSEFSENYVYLCNLSGGVSIRKIAKVLHSGAVYTGGNTEITIPSGSLDDRTSGDIIGQNGESYANIINGFNNTIIEKYNIVNGENNEISGEENIVSGSANEVSNDRNIINGFDNNISGSYNVSNGEENTLSGESNIVNGYNNTVSDYRNIVNGSNHIISNKWNIVNGTTNTVSGLDNLVIGSTNNVSGNKNIIGGDNHTIAGNYNIINGDNHTAGNDGCVVHGEDGFTRWDNSVVSGYTSGTAGKSQHLTGGAFLTTTGSSGVVGDSATLDIPIIEHMTYLITLDVVAATANGATDVDARYGYKQIINVKNDAVAWSLNQTNIYESKNGTDGGVVAAKVTSPADAIRITVTDDSTNTDNWGWTIHYSIVSIYLP